MRSAVHGTSVRVGSFASVWRCLLDVRYSPDSDPVELVAWTPACPETTQGKLRPSVRGNGDRQAAQEACGNPSEPWWTWLLATADTYEGHHCAQQRPWDIAPLSRLRALLTRTNLRTDEPLPSGANASPISGQRRGPAGSRRFSPEALLSQRLDALQEHLEQSLLIHVFCAVDEA